MIFLLSAVLDDLFLSFIYSLWAPCHLPVISLFPLKVTIIYCPQMSQVQNYRWLKLE